MYGFGKEVALNYEAALAKMREELKKEGFGILTEIDVPKTLKEKLNVNFKRYQILGACNPPYAYQALQAEEEIGLLLPCNVIVYETKEEKSRVAVMDPELLVSLTQNSGLEQIAKEVKEKLKRALAAL